LGESTNRVLCVASVIGREFQLDVLRQVLARSEEELEAALEEASAASIIEEHSVVGAAIMYRFSHAFFRQTLYDEIVAPRRIRLHQQVAHTLEEVYVRRLDEHADELAEHFSFYSDTPNMAKAVHYGEVAARRAAEAFAYGEAARELERALVVQDLAEPEDDAHRCDLLLALGEALFPAGETERVITHVAPDALTLADSLNDRARAFRACHLALDCLGRGFRAAQPDYLTWAERADRYAEPDGIERVFANLALATARFTRGQFTQARVLRLEALELARHCADADALFRSAYALLSNPAPQHCDEQVRLAEECAGWSRHGVSGRILGLALFECGRVRLDHGERARAEELWRQVEELAERTRIAQLSLFSARSDVILAIVDGQLEEARALLRRFVERADETGAPMFGRQVGVGLLIAAALHLGRPDLWLATVDEYGGPASLTRPGRPAAWFIDLTAERALCLAQLGRIEAARTLVGPLLDDLSIDDELPLVPLGRLLQAAVVLEHREAAQALAAQLTCVAHLAIGYLLYTCVARPLGDASVLLGDLASARAYYAQALESAGKIRFRPELALTHLHLAELLLKEADDAVRPEALEHLDVAIPELRDMKMQPAFERALALRETLAPAATMAAASESASVTLTVREREIAGLMADGLSNHDIAARLVITEGTVEVHVKHILGKLGFRSRAQVAGWLARQAPR
jgi:DNA-binding CsgD family transcriptional regulator